MLCSSGFNFTSWILDFVPALVTHAKCESSCRGASPSPSGRGWPEGPGEGGLVKNVAHSGPHPPLRGTLSRGGPGGEGLASAASHYCKCPNARPSPGGRRTRPISFRYFGHL